MLCQLLLLKEFFWMHTLNLCWIGDFLYLASLGALKGQ